MNKFTNNQIKGNNSILWLKILMLFVLMLLITLPNIVIAANNSSKSALVQIKEKKVTISVKEKSINFIMNEIRKQTNIGFVINSKVNLEDLKSLSLTVTNESVENCLNQLLKNTIYTFKTADNDIVILPKNSNTPQTNKQASRIRISGTVLDRAKTPVIGAIVGVKNSVLATITDEKGAFSLNINRGDEIEVTFIGYTTYYSVINSEQSEMIITLKEESIAIDDVVVTGYRTISRTDMVASYETKKIEDIERLGATTLDQMLQGQFAGMIVTNSSSRAGTTPKIQIRGTTTLIGNRDPLWVVDDVIQDDPIDIDPHNLMGETSDLKNLIGSQISWLNPMDIESITVLKDASATAIYGSRAANGVIIVTTKKGVPGKTSVSYSGNLKINSKPNYGMFNKMNSQERTLFVDEAFDAGVKYSNYPIEQLKTYDGTKLMFINRKISLEELQRRRQRLETVNTDWFDLLTRTGISQNHGISLRGGSETSTYSASVGYNKSLGQEIGNDSRSLTGRINIILKPHKKITINTSLYLTDTKNNGFVGVNPISYAENTSRNVEAYDESGELSYYLVDNRFTWNKENKYLNYNIINERDNTSATIKGLRMGATFSFVWRVKDWLSYNFTGGYTRNVTSSEQIRNERTTYIANRYRGYDYGSQIAESPYYKAAWYPFGGQLNTSDTRQVGYNLQNKLLFNKVINNVHKINGIVAWEMRSVEANVTSAQRGGYAPDRGDVFLNPTPIKNHEPIGNSNNGVVSPDYDMRVNKTLSNFMSIFASAIYVYDNRYVFDVTARNDFSNKFGQDVNSRFDPTYSFGVAWNVQNERFFKDKVSWLNNLKLKATFGLQGNAPSISPELTLTRDGIMPNINQYFSTINSIPNPDLSWERTKTLNLGMDFMLFNRLNVALDYYNSETNAMTNIKISPEFGIPTMYMNEGILKNSGAEISLAMTVFKSKNTSLDISVNSSKNWNKIGRNKMAVVWDDYLSGTTSKFVKDGYPLGAMWSYSFAGLNPTNGVPVINNLTLLPEDVGVDNLDGSKYLVYSGTSSPDFTGGLTISLRYKQLSLSTSFSMILGNVKRLPSPYDIFFKLGGWGLPDPIDNLSKDLNNRWKKPGDELHTQLPAIVTNNNETSVKTPNSPLSSVNVYSIWRQSDALVVDGSFVRCRDLRLSWRLNELWVKKIGLSSVRIDAGVNNLFVIASKRYNGFDPELNQSVMPKEFNIGLSVSF